jgi:hypothetical protein
MDLLKIFLRFAKPPRRPKKEAERSPSSAAPQKQTLDKADDIWYDNRAECEEGSLCYGILSAQCARAME